jgi:hypothetical protein
MARAARQSELIELGRGVLIPDDVGFHVDEPRELHKGLETV